MDRNGQIGPNNEQIWRQKWTNLGQNGQIWAKMGKFGVEMDQIQLWAQKKSNFSHFGAKFYTILNNIPISGLVLEKLEPKLHFFEPKFKSPSFKIHIFPHQISPEPDGTQTPKLV